MNPIKRLLLIYQLENYESWRFLRVIYSRPLILLGRDERKELVWTRKLFALSIMAGFLFAGLSSALVLSGIPGVVWILGLIAGVVFLPVFFVVANMLLYPIDRVLKHRIVAKARKRIESLHARGTKFIAIAGSYGKTSQKEILSHMLSSRLEVFAPSGTLNTPLGIAQAIASMEQGSIPDIFIVEMGEHYRGDVAELTQLIRPDIGIVTGITQQHLDRMGSIDTIIDTIFELPIGLGDQAIFYLDTADTHSRSGFSRHERAIRARIHAVESHTIEDYRTLADFAGGEWTYDRIPLRTRLLGRHIVRPIAIAVEIARSFGVPEADIARTVADLPYVEHRLQVLRNGVSGVTVIDDSYNGNPESIRAAAQIMHDTAVSGRKILLTPGLVELGSESEALHRGLGREIADIYNLVLLIDTPSSRALATGLADA
ncbi:MAG TPA: Mur ligase family protein [bacterium]|nr:Mur ligase family protein [bacterium]